MTSPLQQLADLAGIVAEYHDIWGTPHATSDHSRRGLLKAMGIACDSDEDIAASLATWHVRHWRQRLAPVQVVPAGQSVRVRLHLPQSEMAIRLNWTLHLEDSLPHQQGSVLPSELPLLESTEFDGEPWQALMLELPAIDVPGYHRLQIGRASCRERVCYVV